MKTGADSHGLPVGPRTKLYRTGARQFRILTQYTGKGDAMFTDEARMFLVQLLGYVALAATLIWIISAGVRSGMSQSREKPSRGSSLAQNLRDGQREVLTQSGFTPVMPTQETSGARKFFVVGVRSDTQEDVTVRIDAATEANAKVKAELKGIVVTEVLPMDG